VPWQRHPDYQPLHCCAERHLWHHGLALAIYNKARTVTKGGETPFSANQVTLAKFFDANKNSVLNAMNFLRKQGWLIPSEDTKGEYKCISHDEWVKARAKEGKPTNCIERKLGSAIYVQPEEAA
jgi:hypothetical protein